MARIRAALRRLHEDDESGTAITEFAVVFPAQFFVTLAIMQFSLFMVGHLLVQHAAFAAARAAVTGDVPAALGGAASPQAAAERAACFVLGPISPADADVRAGARPVPSDAIEWTGGVGRAKGAYAHTTVTINDGTPGYVGARVDHDFVLIIPVVNHWFAGPFGEFWYGPNSARGYNAESRNRGMTCITIKKSSFVPRPWKTR